MLWMTEMENVVMNMTGCPRETANLVVNTICQEVEKVERPDTGIDEQRMLVLEQQGGII